MGDAHAHDHGQSAQLQMNSTLSIAQMGFFFLSMCCSGLRVPVLYSLCNKPGTATVILYVVYASFYKLQWALLVAVLFSLLFILSRGRMTLRSVKCEAVFVSIALFVAFIAWVANCVRLLIHSDALDAMNWFLGAVSIGALIACSKVLSVAF